MLKTVHLLGLCVLFNCTVTLVNAESTAQRYSQLYVFGDSLSDTGRVLNATFGLFPAAPYNNGRFTDKQVWVEYLAEKLQLPYVADNNYAWGGAKSGESHRQSLLIIPGIVGQVNNYLQANTPDAQGLYIIWGGSNDVTGLQTEDAALVQTTLDNILTAATQLHEQGAQHILILNLPDLSQLPDSTLNRPVVNAAVLDFNAQLATRVAELPFNAAYVDAYATFQAMVGSPETYGFSNITDACYNTQTQQVCDSPSEYLFWDDEHPTHVAHQVTADTVYQAIQAHVFMADSALLQLPVVVVADAWYSAQLRYITDSDPVRFELVELQTLAPYTRLLEVATYEAETGQVLIPAVQVGEQSYAARLSILDSEVDAALRFELIDLTPLVE